MMMIWTRLQGQGGGGVGVLYSCIKAFLINWLGEERRGEGARMKEMCI